MAQISPFQALRFTENAGCAKELCCPPYDIISEEQRKNYLQTNPHNIIRLELPREGVNPYENAKKCLDEWLNTNQLKKDDKKAIYLYEEEFSVNDTIYHLNGFICAVHLEEFSKGIVLPHEETLSKAKQDRFDLMCATECNFSQVYSLYDDSDNKVENILNKLANQKPSIEFCDDDKIIHRLWIVPDNEDVQAICKLFAEKKLYIADGHHRYETALRYKQHRIDNGLDVGNSDCMMMFLCSLQNKGLVVFPTHRVIHNTQNFDSKEFLNFAEKYFYVMPLKSYDCIEKELSTIYEGNGKAFGYYDGKESYLLVIKNIDQMQSILPNASKALRELDVTILHTLLLEEFFGINKEVMAAGGRLTYTRDANEAKSLTDENADCCFILNPTRVSEIRDVALAGEKMPQKSTYFYPKLITGLVMNKLI